MYVSHKCFKLKLNSSIDSFISSMFIFGLTDCIMYKIQNIGWFKIHLNQKMNNRRIYINYNTKHFVYFDQWQYYTNYYWPLILCFIAFHNKNTDKNVSIK